MTSDPTAASTLGAGHRDGDVSTREKVAFLSGPAAYLQSVDAVQVRETHMSWVFLAGERVYKLKKPVKYPFLDFSTLEAREFDCREEVRLNRRLAPDVYLGVLPLTLEADGKLALDGEGKTVDWLVMMRRLPEDKLLDTAIARDNVAERQIVGVADLLARFYQARTPAEVPPEAYVDQFAREQATNCSLLTDEQFDLPRKTLDTVLSRLEAVLAGEPELLMRRARERRIVEGHGDLRPEHVCLSEPPVIIDCLEFNRALRLIDPFDELAFLGMECEQLGAPWIGEILMRHCAGQLGDAPSQRLISFYTAYRACLRARLCVAHLFEPDTRDPGKWAPRAAAYLALAERASINLLPQEAR